MVSEGPRSNSKIIIGKIMVLTDGRTEGQTRQKYMPQITGSGGIKNRICRMAVSYGKKHLLISYYISKQRMLRQVWK